MSLQGAEACKFAADDERVDIVRALIGIDRLEVEHMADDGVLRRDAVTAEQLDASYLVRIVSASLRQRPDRQPAV